MFLFHSSNSVFCRPAMEKGVPPLRRLAAGWLLQHAQEFDVDSQAHISHVLTLVPSVACSALRAPEAFAGAAALPIVVDCCRVVLADNSRQGRVVLEELYRAMSDESTRRVQCWQHVEAVASRLLTTGLFKKEVQGPLLPQQLSNHVRRIRKLAQARSGDCEHASELRYARAFPKSEHSVSLEACRRAYVLKRLEAHTG